MDKRNRWRAELPALRALVLEFPVTETFKWRRPCYTVKGGNIGNLFDMKDSFGIAFFKGAQLSDPAGILQAPGPNSRFVKWLCLRSMDDLNHHQVNLRDLVHQAIDIEKQGLKVAVDRSEPDLPDALTEALARDPELAQAFAALTPGRKRGYAIVIGQAKKAETRIARIKKHRQRILMGLGIHDR